MKNVFATKNLVRLSILSAISYVLFFFNFPVPPFPAFLKIDGSEIPAMVALYILGPVAAVLVEFIKNLLNFLLNSSTGGIGELSNFIVGTTYLLTFSLFLRGKIETKRIILGTVAATLAMCLAASLSNYFITIPLYLKLSHEKTMALIIASIIPFNFFKGIVIGILSYFSFAALKPLLYKLKE